MPADHPLRPLREMVNAVLKTLSPEFNKIYSAFGRPSIPPERLLRALLLQVLYTIRSERMLMEQLYYNMLFRWFVGLNLDDPVWDVTVFTKNRERFLEGEIAEKFFAAVLDHARKSDLLSDEHFTVDGTLVEAWASTRVSSPKVTTIGPVVDRKRIPTSISRGASVATIRMLRRLIPMHGCIRKALGVPRSLASWDT